MSFRSPFVSRTVASFTAHNCSNSASYNAATYPTLFTGSTNHDGTTSAVNTALVDDSENAAAPMVISKESVRTLMPAGWGGRIGVHTQLWWGQTSHPDIGYSDRDQPTLNNIVLDVASRGCDVFIPDWMHPTKTTVCNNTQVDMVAIACANAGIRFMVMIDEQFWSNNGSTTATYQADLIGAIQGLMDRYAGNAAYERFTFGGISRPMLLLWDVDSFATSQGVTLDWNAIRSAVTSHANPLLIQYQAGGFSVTQSDGSLSWIDSNADSGANPASGKAYLTSSFFPACTSHSSLIHVSSVWKGFNGTLTRSVAWSLGKYISQQSGFTWLDVWAANAAYVTGGGRLDYVCILTLDDFQEGSAWQAGIQTDVAIAASMAGNLVSFTQTGNEATVRQYNLWGTKDGVTAYLLASVAPGAPKQFDVTNLPAPAAGTYTLYVEAQGMPSLQNAMAPQTFSTVLEDVMALVVPDEGEVQLLKLLTGASAQEDYTLKLYTNAGPPAETDTSASYTEVSGFGYASISLVHGVGWTCSTTAGVSAAVYAQQTFTFTSGPVTVNGYYIVGATSGKVLWAEAFSGAAAIPAGGGTIQVTPRIELA
jgi:hypothetical protein